MFGKLHHLVENYIQDCFLQNCASSTLTTCKSQITKIAHHEMSVPKNKSMPGSKYERKILCQAKVCKNYFCPQWRIATKFRSQRVNHVINLSILTDDKFSFRWHNDSVCTNGKQQVVLILLLLFLKKII